MLMYSYVNVLFQDSKGQDWTSVALYTKLLCLGLDILALPLPRDFGLDLVSCFLSACGAVSPICVTVRVYLTSCNIVNLIIYLQKCNCTLCNM